MWQSFDMNMDKHIHAAQIWADLDEETWNTKKIK
jgi:hypothetical protein